jgi:hypothetical protein
VHFVNHEAIVLLFRCQVNAVPTLDVFGLTPNVFLLTGAAVLAMMGLKTHEKFQ